MQENIRVDNYEENGCIVTRIISRPMTYFHGPMTYFHGLVQVGEGGGGGPGCPDSPFIKK